MKRRDFLKVSGLGAAIALAPDVVLGAIAGGGPQAHVKPIRGAWFEFQHLNPEEGTYWNKAMAAFTTAQWQEKVAMAAGLGMKYLIIQEIALGSRVFYPSKVLPQYEIQCEDPFAAVLDAADAHGVRVLVGCGFLGNASQMGHLMADRKITATRNSIMKELAERYGHHNSFFGWYYPNEIALSPLFGSVAIDYVNECSAVARKLMPQGLTLIAPYNVRVAGSKSFNRTAFTDQLRSLDVDVVAYQDGVGVGSTPLSKDGAYFKVLREAHQAAGRSKIWADMEIFYFEDKAAGNRNLLAADFSRVHAQMEQLSPYVDEILCYELTGLFNRPGTTAFAGDPYGKSVALYEAYDKWYRGRVGGA